MMQGAGWRVQGPGTMETQGWAKLWWKCLWHVWWFVCVRVCVCVCVCDGGVWD